MGRKLNILVVDDEEPIRGLFVRLFSKKDHCVVCAENGIRGIELAGKQKFDIAFIDMRMPGIDGLETFRGLRKLYPKITAVIITGFKDKAKVEAALYEGVVACLSKPFDLKDIQAVLEKEIEKEKGGIKVLAIDDDPAINSVFKRLEANGGCAVETVKSAETALEKLKKTPYDLAFLDVVLPGMDGTALCSRISKDYPNTKVILCIGFSDNVELMKAKGNQGAVYAIEKPFDIKIIRQIIEKAEAEKTDG